MDKESHKDLKERTVASIISRVDRYLNREEREQEDEPELFPLEEEYIIREKK